MSYINQIVEDGVTYDIAAKNLVNGFTQTTPGVNALDAAAGKSLNDSLSNTIDSLATNLRFGIGSNNDKTSYPRAQLHSSGNITYGNKEMVVRYYADANNSTEAILCDKDGNLLPNYVTKTVLGSCLQYGSTYNNIVKTFEIPRGHNVALLLGMRGSIGFAYMFTYWDAAPFKIFETGTAPTITKTGNSNTIKVSHSNSGAVAMMFITGFVENS